MLQVELVSRLGSVEKFGSFFTFSTHNNFTAICNRRKHKVLKLFSVTFEYSVSVKNFKNLLINGLKEVNWSE